MSGLFNIGNAEQFFGSIKRRWQSYVANNIKSTEDLLYVILGLNHLREWIAPGYNPEKKKWPPNDTDEKTISKKIYESPQHIIVRELSNFAKHLRKDRQASYSGGAAIDEWSDIDSVANFDIGPPTAHSVDNHPIEEIIEPLIRLYEDWFSGRDHP
ncbi:conserved hypothetical protein [Rhodospirillaceae bacterium LM-1]|nr:conserved hypothetical protein [Rhodospirillaceae bacterium LM-1]